jgi:tetratricopeptide (TPR) repeat protein
LEHKDRLPAYDRNLLDIYADLWLRQRFDDAMTKLEVQVANYPDDKESKCVLALMYGQLTGDTTRAFALLDEVLTRDPGFQLALSWYADLYARQDRYDLAVDYMKRLLKYHPDSIEARKNLAAYLARQEKYSESINAYEKILEDYPDDFDVLANLHRVAIRQRDFAQARMYLERIREAYSDNPYHMDNCYSWLSNLLFWKGKFKTGMTYRFKALESALATGDSTLIFSDYGVISEYYKRFGMPDSAVYYIRQGSKYASAFGNFNLPMQLISIDTSYAAEARPLFQEALNDLRGRVPQELFTLADALQDAFDAHATLDTAALIEANKRIVQMQLAGSDVNTQSLGVLQIEYGQYEEGRKLLEPFLSGDDETTSGYNYPRDLYLVGVADQQLGDLDKAEKSFTEFLSYWGDPEIELPEIKDARERLARLKSRS